MLKFSKYRVALALIITIILVPLVATACDLPFREETPPPPVNSLIKAPPVGAKILVQAPVQIQSTHPQEGISRVELFVNDQLIRADLPENGVLLQEWIPEQPGPYALKVVPYQDNQALEPYVVQVEVVDSPAVSLLEPPPESGGEQGVAFQAPTATPIALPSPTVIGIEAIPTLVTTSVGTVATNISVVNVSSTEVEPSPTPPLRYPPPPPAPGVPPGPTQDQLPLMYPPVCDQAEFIGVYAANTTDRITINEDNDIPAKTAGGTQVFRAWRLRNTGTCTWGPGYELAFYGGRSMGSGGVAFESIFPADPGRRNAIIDGNRLIVPEGKPNQVAVVEVMLNVPPTPGIHQSYWRMRNPQGIYFGPIIGVTLEVVRDCEFGIYGAPVINSFEILGVGDVYEPENPVDVLAEFGDTITLEWEVINTDSFDLVLTDPLGRVSALSNTAAQGRAQFIASELGTYVVTLYADNGPCSVSQNVNIIVVPRGEDRFQLDIILSPTSASINQGNENIGVSSEVSAGDVLAEWKHYDPTVNEFILTAQSYRRMQHTECPIVDTIFGWTGHCYTDWTEWTATGQSQVIPVGQEAEGAAVVNNVESALCPTAFDPNKEQYGIKYVMEGQKDGQPAVPPYSNAVDVLCSSAGSPTTGELPVEIQGTFNP